MLNYSGKNKQKMSEMVYVLIKNQCFLMRKKAYQSLCHKALVDGIL
jgi:hypothetical protein